MAREIEYANPVADCGAATFDVEGGSSGSSPLKSFDVAATFELELEHESGSGSVDADDGAGGLQFDENMLQDLVFAFQACDVDNNGYLDAHELLAVIRVLAGAERAQNLSLEIVQELIREEREAWSQRGHAGTFDKQTRGRIKATGRKLKAVSSLSAGVNIVNGSVSTGVNIVHGLKRNITVFVTVTVAEGDYEDEHDEGETPAPEDRETQTLDYPMFVHLLTSGRAQHFLGEDHDDWQDQAHQLRLLKHAWVRSICV